MPGTPPPLILPPGHFSESSEVSRPSPDVGPNFHSLESVSKIEILSLSYRYCDCNIIYNIKASSRTISSSIYRIFGHTRPQFFERPVSTETEPEDSTET